MTFDGALGDFLIWLVALVVPGVPFDDEVAGLRAQAGFAVRDGMRIARERGEPTTLAELQAYYPSSPEIERTTALWLQAIDAAPKLPKNAANVPIVGRSDVTKNATRDGRGNLARESLRVAVTYLDERRTVLALVRAARESGTIARFPLETDAAPKWNQAIHNELRTIDQDLRLALEVALSSRESAQQREALLDQLALARCNENEPLLMTQLCRANPLRMAAVGIREAINRGDLTDADLATIERAWAEVDSLEPFRRALAGERCAATLRAMRPHSIRKPIDLAGGNFWAPRFDAAAAMNFSTPLIEGCKRGFPNAVAAFDRSKVQEFAYRTGSVPFLLTFFRSGELAFEMRIAWTQNETNQCHIEVARAALACERYRREKGAWPGKLSDLVPSYAPELPRDPIDGAPLRYRVEGKKAIVYAIDHNHVDDGGVRDPENGIFDWDVVYRLEPGAPPEPPRY